MVNSIFIKKGDYMIMFNSVRFGTFEYINKKGILRQLDEVLINKGYKKPLLFTDDNVIKFCNVFFPKNFFLKNNVILFNGNCTYEETKRVLSEIGCPDIIVALGGGQLLDTAKNLADKRNIDLMNVPTLPSNCAAVSSGSVMYSEKKHEMIGHEAHEQPVKFVLVDPNLLRKSPKNFLISGIGDTLAKWYEIGKRLEKSKSDGPTIELAKESIKICKDQMFSIESLDNIKDSKFSAILDTIFLIAASVGALAGNEGVSVVAHSFYNNYLSLPIDSNKTHGELVAFGILIQLFIERKFNEIEKLVKYYKKIGLPFCLKNLSLTSEEEIKILSKKIADEKNKRVRSIFPNVNEEEVSSAIKYFKR
jgi:uncharacterized oxidoreductase